MDSHSKLSAPDGLIRCPSCNRKVILNNSNLPHFFCPDCHAEITHDIIILFDKAERIGKPKLEQARLKQASRAKPEKEEERKFPDNVLEQQAEYREMEIDDLLKELDDADLESATLFVNPKNGWTVEISPLTGLWYFLFGVFYLFYKGLIKEGCLILIANACLLSFTDGSGQPLPGLVCILVIHVILSLMAKGIMKRRYLEKGWHIK